jgi:hypothetical protein
MLNGFAQPFRLPRLGSGRGAAAPAFDPVTLFDGGKDGGIWLPDTGSLFQDTGEADASAIGDPVARIKDTSPNDTYHADTSTASERPIRRDGYLEYDAVDDRLATGLSVSSSRWLIAVGLLDTSTRAEFVVLDGGAASRIFMSKDGAGTTANYNVTTIHEARVDNVATTLNTRSQCWNAFDGASVLVADITFDAGWDNLAFAGNSFAYMPKFAGAIAVETSGVTEQEFTDVANFFAGRLGVTL